MKYEELISKLDQTVDHLQDELKDLRTGTANASLVENIMVEAYEGTKLSVKELGTISATSASLITVTCWDKTIVEKVAKAIKTANQNLNPVVDNDTVKIPVPQLTEEQRQQYVKIAKQKLEEAKIAVRNIRQDAIKSVEEREENGLIGEDELERERRQIEDGVKKYNGELQQIFDQKEKDLLTF